MPLPEESDDDEGVFDKAKSVFKSFKGDTKSMIKKMIEKDFEMCKLSKILKDEQDMKSTMEIVEKNYDKLKNVFVNLSIHSSQFPNVGSNELEKWAHECDFYDATFNQVAY